MLEIALLLLALGSPFPQPCVEGSNCWMTWDPADRATEYQIWSGETYCDTANLTSWWPRPTPTCPLHLGEGRTYKVRACNEIGCSEFSKEEVDWVGQEMRCFEGTIEVPCNKE